jgi:hypothetical protein
MKDILSLFDHSGNWPAFYENAGHNVMHCDIKNAVAVDVERFDVAYFFEELGIENVDAIIAAPPCTDFTNAGAQYWPAKDADGRSAKAVELVYQTLRCVEFWKPHWWVLENPVGRLPKLVPELGKPRLMFDPCDYAGWLDISAADLAKLDELRARNGEGEFSIEEIELVKRCNAYTKKTCLWGEFELPEKRRIEPVKVCKQGSWLQRLGGKGEKTKEARSETPLGFALAFYAANPWSEAHGNRCLLRRMLAYVRDLEIEDPARAAEEVEAEFGFGEVSREEFLAALPVPLVESL